MRLGEAGKAVGVALALLALNLLATTLAVVVYAQWIAPGRPEGFYAQVAPDIAAWTAPAGGAALFFAAAAWLGQRPGRRQPYGFILRAWAAYVVLDVVSGAALGEAASLLSLQLLGSLAVALLGGLAGAALAARLISSREQTA